LLLLLLMVLMTRTPTGLGTLSRLLLGSVSDYVVKHSPCPVLVARWEEDDKQA
jgi:nucleotide-binding universal stress UspA family protein